MLRTVKFKLAGVVKLQYTNFTQEFDCLLWKNLQLMLRLNCWWLCTFGLNCQVSARVQTTLAFFGHLPFQLQSQKRLIQSMISVANQTGQKLRSENQGVSPNTDNFVRLDILGCSLFRAEPQSICQQSSFAACSPGSSCFTLCSLQYILICKDVI